MDPHGGEIVGISLAVAPTDGENNRYDAIYVPLGHHDPGGLGLNADAAAVLALQLYALERDWFAAQLPAHGSLAAELERPVALFTARMEYHGVLLDGPGLTAAAAAAGAGRQERRHQ